MLPFKRVISYGWTGPQPTRPTRPHPVRVSCRGRGVSNAPVLPGKITPQEGRTMQTTPYQLNRDLGTILGYKPARMGEKVVRYQLHAGMVTVLFNRTAVAKKGRREMA